MKKRTDKSNFEPHEHRCSDCLIAWHHDPIEVWPEPGITQDEHERLQTLHNKAHSCPKCGKQEFHIDNSGTKPAFINTGERCEPCKRIPKYQDDDRMAAKRGMIQMDNLMRRWGM